MRTACRPVAGGRAGEFARRTVGRVQSSGAPASPAPAGPADSSYRLAAAVRLRLLGTVLAVLGGLVLVVGLLVALLDVPDTAFTVALTVSIALLLLSGYGLLRAAPLVSLDEVGYRVRYLRGAGVVAARWREVQDVVTATVHGDDCVVLRPARRSQRRRSRSPSSTRRARTSCVTSGSTCTAGTATGPCREPGPEPCGDTDSLWRIPPR